jgi:hypothetical protein
LKAGIEAAGWRTVDEGTAFTLLPARPPDVVEDGRTYYGSPASVPSRLDEPPAPGATVALVAAAGDSPDPALQALSTALPRDTQVLVVAAGETSVRGPVDEVIRTAAPFSAGDAVNVALRRAIAETVVVLEPGRRPHGDVVSPLVEALRDPSVAIAGEAGLVSADLHRFETATGPTATTVSSGCYAFRRDEAAARGPIDGRLQLPASVAAWLSLLLRDEGEAHAPRRALLVDLPIEPAEATGRGGDQARQARRDGYRISDRFGHRAWLAGELPQRWRRVGDGADEDQQPDDAEQPDDADDA